MKTFVSRSHRASQSSLASPAQGAAPRARAAVRQRLASPQIQTKLEIGPANDAYEREADAVADRVMRMPDPAAGGQLQRMCADCEEEREG
ncbi:MAG: hypothetical protein AAGD01_10805 [Acidobacteriota bacterium]